MCRATGFRPENQPSEVFRKRKGTLQMDQQLLHRVKNCRTLPAIPALPLQVLQMCRDESADCKKMADVISKDPSFVAKLLNVANSSFYGGARHKVTTVTQAVTLLGMNSIATLAFCFSLYRDLKKKGGSHFDHAQYWKRSILSSLAARVLGKWAKVPNYEEIFLSALLQDLGMLVLSETLGSEYGQLCHEAGQDHHLLAALERDRYGSDHTEVGAWLAQTWELPDLMQKAVRGSHDPQAVEVAEEAQLTVVCVAVSGRLADLWCGSHIDSALQIVWDTAKQCFEMEPTDLAAIVKDIAEGIPDISSFFQIHLGKPEDIEKVVLAAEQMLLTAAPQ